LPENERAAPDGDGQSRAKAVLRKRREERTRIGLVADRPEGRDDARASAPRDRQALVGEPG